MRYIDKLARAGYFGDVTFKFQGGRVTLISENRTFKPEELSV